jgi:hypothetical protein
VISRLLLFYVHRQKVCSREAMLKERVWLLDVLTARWTKEIKAETSLLDLLVYMGQNRGLQTTWEEAVESSGLVLPADGVATRPA